MQRLSVFRGLYIFYVIFCFLSFTAQADYPTGNFQININSRETVRNFYNLVYNASSDISADWAGDISACDPGESSQKHKQATLRRINFYRAMAGVPSSISFSESANAKAKSAALLASANNALSHYPPSSWDCYSLAGAQASANSNIALGETGPAAITAYIEDAGSHNLSVGHRRWLLYPQTKTMGTGDISPQGEYGRNASAIIVFDNHYGLTRPQTRNEYVSWPPAGYVPYQLVFPRWSFSLPNADFSQAKITVILNNQEIPLKKLPVTNGFGENTLVWEMNQVNPIKPETDLVYHISIHNVLINRRRLINYSYKVKVFDPAREERDTAIPSILGDSQITAGQSGNYTVKTIPGVDSYQILRARKASYQRIATAENALGQLHTNTPISGSVISSLTANSGHNSYYLSHSTGDDQQLSFNQRFLIHADSSLEFYSRINCAMPDESARVQISLDDGTSWQDIYEQAGIRFGLRETDFTAHTINLGAYAGKVVRVRFNYTFNSGWRCSTANSGWYLDDIAFNHVDELTNAQLTTIRRQSFQFRPSQATDYILAVRGTMFSGFYGQWGTSFPVYVTREAPALSEPTIEHPLSVTDPKLSNRKHNVIFKATDSSSHRCEYTEANLDFNGNLKLTVTDLSCLKH